MILPASPKLLSIYWDSYIPTIYYAYIFLNLREFRLTRVFHSPEMRVNQGPPVFISKEKCTYKKFFASKAYCNNLKEKYKCQK